MDINKVKSGFIGGTDKKKLREVQESKGSYVTSPNAIKPPANQNSLSPKILKYLLNKDNIPSPDYHKLNKEPNARLLHAVIAAYMKHHMDFADIGWDQLDDILFNAIVNEIGDEEYIKWMESFNEL